MAGPDPEQAPVAAEGSPPGFRLLRYFIVASLAVFLLVAASMVFIERAERNLFKRAQDDLVADFRQMQERFARQQEQASERDLFSVHESAHVKVTRVLGNALWDRDIAPFLAQVQAIDASRCLAAGASPCTAELRRQIMALGSFRALDARIAESMRRTTVFKVKIFDLRGLTVYSSEHAQVGEDKRGNQGWRNAVRGQAASEFIHRDSFSAFEGVVENRDLISSYVPLRAPGDDRIVGVFEIYSDVTAFLEQIRAAGRYARSVNAEVQREIEKSAASNQSQMDGTSDRLMAIVGGLLLLLFVALFFVARHAQEIIDGREREREAAILREQRLHREKMAALGSMASNVAHEIGNPLAAISGWAQELAAREGNGPGAAAILEQTQRISAMTRRISDFAAARRGERDVVDVNQTVQAVCDFSSFDRHFSGTRIEFRGDPALPPRAVVPEQLTEVLMNLLQVCVEGDATPRAHAPGRITVETVRRAGDAVIRIDCDEHGEGGTPPWASGPRIEATSRVVAGMGGRLAWRAAPEGGVEIVLPEAVA